MDTARAIERKRAVLPTSQKTAEVLLMMFDRRGNAEAELKREEEERNRKLAEEEAAMKSGDVSTLLASVRAKQANLKSTGDDD